MCSPWYTARIKRARKNMCVSLWGKVDMWFLCWRICDNWSKLVSQTVIFSPWEKSARIISPRNLRDHPSDHWLDHWLEIIQRSEAWRRISCCTGSWNFWTKTRDIVIFTPGFTERKWDSTIEHACSMLQMSGLRFCLYLSTREIYRIDNDPYQLHCCFLILIDRKVYLDNRSHLDPFTLMVHFSPCWLDLGWSWYLDQWLWFWNCLSGLVTDEAQHLRCWV